MKKVALRMMKSVLRIIKYIENDKNIFGMIKVTLGIIKVVLGFKMDY